MKILHGTWVPEAEAGFIQTGSFYLWIETDETVRRRTKSKLACALYPHQLTVSTLATFLSDQLGIQPIQFQGKLESELRPQYFLLPTVDQTPLPSLELARFLEIDIPETFAWQYWQIDCYPMALRSTKVSRHLINPVIRLLNDLHFLTLYNLADLQLGADLLFWYHYSRSLRQVLLKDHYIPSLRYRDLTANSSKTKQNPPKAAGKATRAKKSSTQSQPEFEIYAGWEIISESYERNLDRYAEWMPLICCAGFADVQDTPKLHDRRSLLRHFSECLIQDIVTQTPYTGGLTAKVADSLLATCLSPRQPGTTASAWEQYQQWQVWRDRINRSQIQSSFYLCFQLDAPIKPDQPWQLEFQVAAKQDPSLRLSLQEYWQSTKTKRKQLLKQFGTDFEQHLLTNLGYAARIYTKLWAGLETNEPSRIWLGLDEAFEFLKETAWVLEDAGYKVIVPSWWTPKGRQRAKIRLRATGRKASAPDKSKGYFTYDTLVAYQYELAIGEASISEREWQALVQAKTPLVNFRGQWIELDQDKMKEMLEFWKKQQLEQPELSLSAFMKLTAEGEASQELEVNLDQSLAEMLAKIEDKSQLEPIEDPQGFQGKLREYQKRGLSWLSYLESLGLNGCLADDMGLGKSAQVIARLVQEREAIGSSLVEASPTQASPGKSGTAKSGTAKSGTAKSGTGKSKTAQSQSKLSGSQATQSTARQGKQLKQAKQVVSEQVVPEQIVSEQVVSEQASPILPTLLIAPTSVVGNWQKEIEKFAPQLRSIVHHGNQRIQTEPELHQAIANCDVLITSFTLARKDEKLLASVTWQRLVVDEAQNIKNPKAAQTKAINKLSAQHRLALTGTPVENRLLDLWSIFNFLNPGYLGKESQFRQSFEIPIQKENDRQRAATLKKLVEPFILRRVKTDQSIIKDLPDKVEQKLYCNLTKEQASLYEAVVKAIEQDLDAAEGIQRKGLILSTLLKLKQICNHPRQFLQDRSDFTPTRSHKLDRLTEMLKEAIEAGESVLIFTQFTELADALEKYIKQTLHYNTYYIHGGTDRHKRERMITEFQDPETEPSVFVLSLKAGGVGITLTKANHVFHFDRWWNPAVEDQATDRAFRIGQQKNVFVHKFVAIGTLEERIDQMIEDKKKLAGAIVGADESWLTELDNEAFKQLIKLNRSTVMD